MNNCWSLSLSLSLGHVDSAARSIPGSLCPFQLLTYCLFFFSRLLLIFLDCFRHSNVYFKSIFLNMNSLNFSVYDLSLVAHKCIYTWYPAGNIMTKEMDLSEWHSFFYPLFMNPPKIGVCGNESDCNPQTFVWNQSWKSWLCSYCECFIFKFSVGGVHRTNLAVNLLLFSKVFHVDCYKNSTIMN